MNQYEKNKFLLSLLVIVAISFALIMMNQFLDAQFIDYVMVSIIGIVALIGVRYHLMISLLVTFIVTLLYGLIVIVSGTTDFTDPIGINYWYLILPVSIAVITGFIGLTNKQYMRIATGFEGHYEELVRIDELTGFRNNTEYFEILTEEINRKVRYNHDLSLVLLQIESFNELNELYGKTQGEKFLKYLSEFVVDLTRNVDKHYRIAENVFALVLPNTDTVGAKILKERFIEELESLSIVVKSNNQPISIDIDIVFEEYGKEGMSAREYHDAVADQLTIKPRGEYEA